MPRDLEEKLVKKLREEAEKSLSAVVGRLEAKYAEYSKLVDEKGDQLVKEFKERVEG